MTASITWKLIVKELRLGPRSPVLFYAIALPFLMTFLIGSVFGSLFEPAPRLALHDPGGSAVGAAIQDLDDIEITFVDSIEDLTSGVEADDFDAGLVLPDGFDDGGGEATLFVSGSSLASTRLALTAVVEDLVGDAVGVESPVDVVVTRVGEESGVPVEDRLVPMIVFYALVIAGLFMPAASLVEERDGGTIQALLITPARMGDVLVAKGVVAAGLAVLMSLVTLGLNGAFGGRPLLLTLILAIGAVMLVEFGLVLGLWARDTNTLFTAIKGAGIVILLPVVFIIWPDLPQWIPQLVPTYYFLYPVYEVGVLGAEFGDVWLDLVIAAGLCVALAPPVVAYARRAERRLAIHV